jgi:hypothetical protein
MIQLVIPKHVYARIVSSVLETPAGLETGVTLFGTSLEGIPGSHGDAAPPDSGHVVLAIAGPGRRSTHEPAHYSGDEGHANEVFDALLSVMPGLRWIGELHLHPRGMTWLSSGDRRTVRQILTGHDDTLHPDEFIAGVMQRQDGAVDIYPYHFTRERLAGRAMGLLVVDSDAPVVHQARLKGIQNDRPSVCTEPEGSRKAEREAPGHHWLRQWWERARRHGGKVGHR